MASGRNLTLGNAAGLTARDPKSDLRQPQPNVRSGPTPDRLLWAIDMSKVDIFAG
jgi:hypothetical protein